METKLLNGNNKEAIAEASKILQDGGLVDASAIADSSEIYGNEG